MDVLKSNHCWQLTWITWTVFAHLLVPTSCDTIGNTDRTRGAQRIRTSSMYIDLNHPATCSGYIKQIHYCYHVINLGGFVSNNPMHEAVVQIWREETDTEQLDLVGDYELKQDTSQDSRNDFVCRNKTLLPQDYILIRKDDVIGVTLPIFTLMSPLQLISAKSSRLGLYFEPLSVPPATTLQKSSLTMNPDLVLHLFAFIEPVTSPTTSTPNPVIGNINITTTSTSVVPSHAPVQTTTVSNIITSPPISTSTSNHITTAASTHELTAFTPASTIIPTKSSDTQPTISVPTSPTQIHPQSTSLSGDVRVMSSLPQPTSTLQGETPTETLHVTPPDAHSRSSSSLRMSTVPSPLSRDLSKPTTPTMLPQPTTQPDTRDQPSLTTPTESSSMSTIVAGIAALILLLATLAGCTVIGGLAFVHCKPRPKNVGSTNDKDAEDNLSLKDISPSSSLNKSTDSGIAVSSISSQIITELATTIGKLPASLPITMEPESSSVSGGQNTPIPEIFVLPPNKNDGQSSEVVPPPPLLSLQEPGKSSSSSDHDYEELVSQPNSINVEKIVSDKKTTVPIVENGASARSHCPLVKNNSMPILERKEHRPAAHHEYDEPNNFRKKIPDYQNKSMIIVNQNKNRMRIGRTHTVSGPWIRRAAPSSKTEDYEVPVMSFGHETRQRASSATTRPFKHSSPVKTKLSKAKSLLVETHVQHSNQQASTKNEGGSLIKDSTAEAADCMPKSTGSCLFELGTEEADSQPEDTMDGPYCEPPLEERQILVLFKQLNVESISLKSIIIPPRELFGRFGSQTVKTSWRKDHEVTMDVSLKAIFSDEPKERLKLLQEAAILAQFRHPNVVRLQGIISNDNVVMLVLEHFPNEDLTKFLVQMGRKIIPPDTPKLLLTFSQQVALGMQYLSSKGFVHKDLAARNVFVTGNNTCKVGELRKSKELSNIRDDDMLDKILVKWTAPEAMYHHRYSTASDIWSYGCLLYEIWSLGRIPFKTLPNREVIEKVDSGYRLPPPPGCPRSIYKLMIQCWNPRPLSRPHFKEILNVLLKDEVQSLQIPVKDASTHEAAIKLGAELEASTYMYTDLQRTYTTTNMTTQRVRGASQNDTSGKQMGEDYDHIYVQNYVTSFPTSSADIECMYKGQSILSSASSLVPDPYLYSKSPTRNGDAPMSSSHLQQSLQDILDSDYEEIIDTR